jgi:hypothetical protein
VLEYINQKTKDQQTSAIRCIVKCLRCCLWCLEKILRYINRNAYILIAMHGYSFCEGAGHAVGLLLRNAVRVATLNWVGDFTLFLGRVFVAGLCTVGAVLLFPTAKPDVQNIIVPAVIVFLCSWLASAAFTGLFEMGIDAVFLCFLEDEERNDGSPGHEKRAPKMMQRYADSHKEDAADQENP